MHFNVTEHPTGAWIVQQLRGAFPEDRAPQYLILDRDGKFSGEVATMLEYLGSELIRTAYRSPWQNGVAERWVGSCRREVLRAAARAMLEGLGQDVILVFVATCVTCGDTLNGECRCSCERPRRE